MSHAEAPDIRLPLFFTPSSASQAAGLAFLKRPKARTEDRDAESGSAVTDPQANALITWCATPDPEHAILRAITQPPSGQTSRVGPSAIAQASVGSEGRADTAGVAAGANSSLAKMARERPG